ncbi:hypothetical protein ILUMI_26118 [Ignelater luminosus]|uniref:Uncharacterized protein n=1 Tax=Ignelater luminosus TaxID=2038154 RepID=A0A8K0FZE5_IGNLU|nr:hypothetical protein ILUMI_26118 [Ignelater luminosus]
MNTPTRISTQDSVQLLSSAASSTSLNILKSYYLTKCRTITSGALFDLPQRFTKSTVRCPRCCVQYEDGDAMYRIKPECKKSRFARKLLKKQKNEKAMTRYQQKYLNNLIHKGGAASYNTLVIKCGVCKNEVTEKLKKAKQSSKACITPKEQTSVSSPRKKKKRKDRFSGLNKDVILSVTPTPNKPHNTSNFVALEVTPNRKNNGEEFKHKKRLFTQNQQNQLINKLEKSRDKKLQKKSKQKKLKGLQSILNNSKQKSSSSSTLKQFLTSI